MYFNVEGGSYDTKLKINFNAGKWYKMNNALVQPIDWSIQYRFKWNKKYLIKKATPYCLENFYLWVASAELPKWGVQE